MNITFFHKREYVDTYLHEVGRGGKGTFVISAFVAYFIYKKKCQFYG